MFLACVCLPAEIRIELKDRYTHYYESAQFFDALPAPLPCLQDGILILPAEMLLTLSLPADDYRIIAFGHPELLEPSFLAGARDYLKDPWNCTEMLIRSIGSRRPLRLDIREYTLIHDGYSLLINGVLLPLTEVQSRLIYLLIRERNQFLSYTELSEWAGTVLNRPSPSLHVHICRIRSRMKKDLPPELREVLFIENFRGRGYRLRVLCE